METRITALDHEKRQSFMRTVSSVLSSEIAELAFGQIIDGFPTSANYERMQMTTSARRTETEGSVKPSEKSIMIFRGLRAQVIIDSGDIDLETAKLYQDAVESSDLCRTLLLGMVAARIHNLAIWVFNQFHHLETGRLPPFYHPHFLNCPQYPQGTPEVVGYWAETEIFGGIVAFDRRNPENQLTNDPIHGIFIHPPPRNRMFKLSNSQLEKFAAMSEERCDATLCLPFSPQPNAELAEPDDAISMGIYRTSCDRLPRETTGITHWGCTRRKMDDDPSFPHIIDFLKQRGRWTDLS